MCLFCASLPAVFSIGIATRANQRRDQVQAEEQRQSAPKPLIPAGPATALTMVGIVTAAVIVHTQQVA